MIDSYFIATFVYMLGFVNLVFGNTKVDELSDMCKSWEINCPLEYYKNI